MTADNTTTATGMFKRVYDSGTDLFKTMENLYAGTWKKFKLSPLKPSPQGTYGVVVMSGNNAGGPMNETQSFPDPGNFNPQNPVVSPKENNFPLAITGRTIELGKTNAQAFAITVDEIMNSTLQYALSNINFQGLNKGTGQLSTANGAGVATASLVVANVLPFKQYMKIDLWTAVGGTKEVAGATITAINPSTATLTLDTTYSWTSGDIIVQQGVLDGVTSLANAKPITGLQAICDTTTYSTTFEGISTTTYPQWEGNVIAAGTVPISQDLLQQTYNRIRAIGNGNPNFLISNYGQWRNFMNTELQKVRYEPQEIKGGATVVKWMDMEWMIDKDYDINEVGFYDLDNVEKIQSRDIALADYTGNTSYQITGYNQIGMYYTHIGNLGTWKRNAHGRLTQLTEPTF